MSKPVGNQSLSDWEKERIPLPGRLSTLKVIRKSQITGVFVSAARLRPARDIQRQTLLGKSVLLAGSKDDSTQFYQSQKSYAAYP